MLFEGYALQFGTPPSDWRTHPFNGANNVNGIDADVNGNGHGREVHTLASGAVLARQLAYVRKVSDTLGRAPNVLYEVANESSSAYSTAWQYRIIRELRRYETSKGRRHPIGMTHQYYPGSPSALRQSAAEWISPGGRPYVEQPPLADGHKVVLLDTDHLCGICAGSDFVWKALLRGNNVLYMDPWDALAERIEARRAMGQAAGLARSLGLVGSRRCDGPFRYCLAHPGRRYLLYAPKGGTIALPLAGPRTRYRASWIEAQTGLRHAGRIVRGGAWREFRPSFTGPAVLFLRRI